DDGVPDLIDSTFFQCATSQNPWLPFVVFTSQNMQGTLVHMPGNGDIGMVIAIVFVDNDQISHFHQPFFNALQIIAATGNL
ncbi:hypothetical protein EOS_42635, partial [Caballeronia mineralivorans PML1(12)]